MNKISSFPQKLKVVSRRDVFFDDQPKYLPRKSLDACKFVAMFASRTDTLPSLGYR